MPFILDIDRAHFRVQRELIGCCRGGCVHCEVGVTRLLNACCLKRAIRVEQLTCQVEQNCLHFDILVTMNIMIRFAPRPVKLISVAQFAGFKVLFEFILIGGDIFRHHGSYVIVLWFCLKSRAYSVICRNKLPVDCVVGSCSGSSRLFYFPNTVKCIVIGWYAGGPSNDMPPAVLPPLIYSELAPQ